MYHKIKSCRTQHSIRHCAETLGLSPATVAKYDRMSHAEAVVCLSGVNRTSQFAVAHDFIVDQLGRFPNITATKLLRKVRIKYPDISVKVRSFRNYIRPLRGAVKTNAIRYYEPILDMKPGHQVQVDMGERKVERIGGSKFKVYFVSFVFSYSRMQFVYFTGRHFNTESFIKAHKAAFAYFGGVASEFVYDQTKLVVIREQYREVVFNQRFSQFALESGFTPHVCEGYDPESKGKVERCIRYIKESFLYGEYFKDLEDIRTKSLPWLDNVANCRIHAVTNVSPVTMFAEEQPLLRHTPTPSQERETRWADKTGLISFLGNKYSVPHLYQRKMVGVKLSGRNLYLFNLETNETITEHKIPAGKGKVVKNRNHYREYRKDILTLTKEAEELFSDIKMGKLLIERVKQDNPKIKRDQVKGLCKLHSKYQPTIWQDAIATLDKLPSLRVTLIASILETFHQRQRTKGLAQSNIQTDAGSKLDRSTAYYMGAIVSC